MENNAYIALSRQRSLRTEMDIIANNIANANTPAFKREGLIFQEFLADTGPQSQRLSYVQDAGLSRDLSDGPMQHTGNPFDIAIHGQGYFVVETEVGERYTRNGRFQLNEQGQLITGQGHLVKGGGGPILIPSDQGEITISSSGKISTEEEELVTIDIVNFEKPLEMRKAAGGLYVTSQAPIPVQEVTLTSGMLEQSNVQPVLEMAHMIRVHREYASVQKFIQTGDDRIKKAIQQLSTFN